MKSSELTLGDLVTFMNLRSPIVFFAGSYEFLSRDDFGIVTDTDSEHGARVYFPVIRRDRQFFDIQSYEFQIVSCLASRK